MTPEERTLLLAVADTLLHQGDWARHWPEMNTLRDARRAVDNVPAKRAHTIDLRAA